MVFHLELKNKASKILFGLILIHTQDRLDTSWRWEDM